MGPRAGVTLEDVAAELKARERLDHQLREVVGHYGGEQHLIATAERLRKNSRSEAEAGRTLCEKLPEDLRRRVATLMGLEGPMLDSLDGQLDFWGVVWMGSQLAEAVLGHLLGAPAREAAGPLLETLGGAGPQRQVLEAWLSGQPLTLAALQVILQAFREAQAQHRAEPVAALSRFFGPEEAGLFCGAGPESCLEKIRGLKVLAEAQSRPLSRLDYVELLKWLVGARSLSLWDRQGPRPSPPRADVAILHHSLRLSRLTAGYALSAPETSQS
jgi:hypothetical protein